MATKSEEFHELTTTSSKDSGDTSHHPTPWDRHLLHLWVWEPPTKAGGVLTADGMAQIAHHQYTAGHYTYLDNALNPVWTALTECLPMSMAPNVVTSIGGFFCLVSYFLTWPYLDPTLSSEQQTVPAHVLLCNGISLILYYTFDCMDGKQARRTASSSPLGQLFDHGIDCLCLLTHLSSMQAWFQAPPALYFTCQATLQVGFFVAQWQEYYTGVLAHATGQIGVTEVTYALASFSIMNAFVADRDAMYSTTLFGEITARHVMVTIWIFMILLLIESSTKAVFAKVSSWKARFSAVAKWTSPALTAAIPLFVQDEQDSRWISLSVGLALCLITIKFIVFSMARQAYAVIQLDIVPLVCIALWVQYDSRLTAAGKHLCWQVATAYYLLRIMYWTHTAITQLCQRLGIKMFRIQVKKE